jgi:hypothetical protein
MITSLGPENTIAGILKELNLSVAAFCMYQHESSVSRSTVERCLSFKREFTNEEAKPLLKLAGELREVQQSFPCRLDFSDVAGISGILAYRRKQQTEERAAHERQQREAEIEQIEPY